MPDDPLLEEFVQLERAVALRRAQATCTHDWLEIREVGFPTPVALLCPRCGARSTP